VNYFKVVLPVHDHALCKCTVMCDLILLTWVQICFCLHCTAHWSTIYFRWTWSFWHTPGL